MKDDIISKACEFARKRHGDQKDDEGKSYFLAHLCVVARLITTISDNEDLHAAAYLHDTLEDTDTTYEELKKKFGHTIADLVNEVTHESGDKEGENHKGYYFPRLKTQDGILLKFCDRTSNISRMTAWAPSRRRQYLEKSKFWASEV